MGLLKNKVFIISIALWCFITIVRILNHIAWFDEAHAWTIAEELNLFEIFKLSKIEGHTFIWYLLLMPFAKFHWGYPYVMQFLNWIFCLIALLILWSKAPFSNFIKALITFSYPFLFLYSVYARCYSIGIMLLFLLAALYIDKLKHPIIYSLALVMCANTSLMALIGASAFGLLFLFDFIKSKPDKKLLFQVFFILIIGVILVLHQVIGIDETAIANYKGIQFNHDIIIKYIFVLVVLFIFCVFPLLLNFKKNIKPLFFILFSWLILTYVFLFKFYGHYWNHSFYYIYFLMTGWLYFETKESQNLKELISGSILSGILIIVSITNFFIPNLIKNDRGLYDMVQSPDITLSKIILKDETLIGQKIIVGNNSFLGYMLLPYHKFELLNYCGDGIFNYNYLKGAFESKYCYDSFDKSFQHVILSGDRVATLLNESREAYTSLDFESLFKTNNNEKVMLKSSNNVKYVVEIYKCMSVKDKNVCLYKISQMN